MEEKMSIETKITRESFLGEILKEDILEKVTPILQKYKLPCVTCPIAALELKKLKIEDISKFYGIELENFLEEINLALEY